jgi:hypothetical protein
MDLPTLLDGAAPSPAQRDRDFAALPLRPRRAWWWLGAALAVGVAAVVLLRPTPAPSGHLELRVADQPGAEPLVIDFSYPLELP